MSQISITPIGTCRINTPLKRGSARSPIRLDYQRIYGFAHTSDEALQQLLFRAGERTFPAEVLPILFRPGVDYDAEGPAETQADLTIIEISSGKTFLVDDVAVQSNYLTRYFADFFAVRRRAEVFWEIVRRGDQAQVQAFVARDRSAQLYTPQDREMLGKLRQRIQTFDDVYADMAKMTEILGKDRVLFVTHVNGVTPDGNVVATRDKLIRWVKLAAQRLGVECFDPTQLMLEFGQERAMERDGLDLTHFTNPFYDRWFARLHRDFVVGRMVDGAFDEEGPGGSDASILAESIAITMASDDFFEGSRQLFAALKVHPDSPILQLMQGELLEKLGDFQGARHVLDGLVGSPEMTADVRQSHARVLLETGDASGALAIAGQLLADEYENDEIYAIAGSAAERLGDQGSAQRYRKLAFRLDPSNHAAAVSVLARYRAQGEDELYEAWLDEVLEVLDNRGAAPLAQAIGQWALAQRDAELLKRALPILARRHLGLAGELIDEARQFGMALALLDVAPKLALMPDLTEKVERAIRLLVQACADEARNLLTQGQVIAARTLALRCLAVAPANAIARRTERASMVALLNQMRSAPDDGTVLAIGEAAEDAIYASRAIASLYAKALINQNRLDEAKEVARRIQALEPDDIEARAEYAAISAATGDFAAALSAYGDLAREPPERTHRHATRIRGFLSRAAQRGLRQGRQLAAEGRFEEAIALFALLEHYTAPVDRLPAERARIGAVMRDRIRELQEAGGNGLDAALPVLQTLLAHDSSPVPVQLGIRQIRGLIAEGRFAEAIAALRLLEARPDAAEAVPQQVERIRSSLRMALRQLDEAGDNNPHAALELLHLMLALAPDDAMTLRRAVTEAMRLRDSHPEPDAEAVGAAIDRDEDIHDPALPLLEQFLDRVPGEASVQLCIRHARALAADGLFEQAIVAVRLLARIPGLESHQAAEFLRIRSALRLALRQVDDADAADFSEIQRLLRLSLDIEPNDAVVLRRAALEAMRSHDFEIAVDLWRRLERVAPMLNSVGNNILRCENMLRRQARRARHKSADRAMAA